MFFKLLVFGFLKKIIFFQVAAWEKKGFFFFYNLANQVVCDLSEKL